MKYYEWRSMQIKESFKESERVCNRESKRVCDWKGERRKRLEGKEKKEIVRDG